MAAYADYAYYTGTYLGVMPAADYGRLSLRSSAYLDNVTFNRIRAPVPDAVKNACCACADILYQQENGGVVTSASNDGYSETYESSGMTPSQRMYAAASLYLAMTGLMYRGV